MKKKNAKRFAAAALSLVMLVSLLAGCKPAETQDSTPPSTEPTATPEATGPEYIPAPYTAASEDELTAKFLDPVFYENGDGEPTIGVTLLGVIHQDGKYFRDLNNNQVLDDFEDWRLDPQTRAEAMAKALTDTQLTHQVVNVMAYSPKSTKVADVTDGGSPVWTKVYPAQGGFGGGAADDATNIEWLNTSKIRTYVLRSNPETEVAVWFNNGLEQYSEFDAIQNNEVAVPFFTFTNPISHGLPNSDGVAAATLGDGNADLVLEDAQYDRVVMWAKGIDGLYGPQVDLVTDPRWSRNSTTYGEREDNSAEIAKNLTIGYQNGDQGMVPGSVLITIKHFPGDGAAFNGFESHGQTGRYRVYTVENSLADYQLKPFIAAFEAGAAGVMPAYSQPIIDARIAPQSITYNGKTYDIRYEGRGNAFNEDILLGLLRDVLGFKGLINSDSLQMAAQQGVEDLDAYQRMVLFVKAGCDCGVIDFSNFNVQQMGATGETGETAEAPNPSDLLDQALAAGDVTRADLERAAANRLLPQMQSGNLDNPYRDLDESVKAVNEVAPKMAELAEETHLKSVVLMKNSSGTLPMAELGKVYIQGFNAKSDANTDGIAAALQAQGFTVVDDYTTADVAFLRVTPTIVGTGSSNLAILDLGEDMETPVYDNNAKRTAETAEITTVQDMKTFKKVADAVHANGGKVIGEINASNAWILTNMEPYCDALIGTFNTSDDAIAQVVAGTHAPTGKLPITMVADASVIALVETDLDGEIWDVCVSPNDVPGYAKDQHMDAAVLAASPSGSYAYKDADGNLYVSGFGLTFEAVAPGANKPAGGNEEPPADDGDKPAAPAATADAVVINYDATPDAFVGKWTLTAAYANGEMLGVKENACFLDVEKSIDTNKLVDEAAYIHADAVNLSATMTFDSSISGNSYKCSSNWEKWTTVNVKGEGDCEFFGANQFKIRDDDEGVFFKEITGTEADELLNVIAVNGDGQLLVGYSEDHIENDKSATWEYVYIFSK